MQLFLPHFAAQ